MNATDEETQIDKDIAALYRKKKKLIKKRKMSKRAAKSNAVLKNWR